MSRMPYSLISRRMRCFVLVVLMGMIGTLAFGSDFDLPPFRLHFSSGFRVSPDTNSELGLAVTTPARVPVRVAPVERRDHQSWPAAIADFLLARDGRTPEEFRLKQEAGWTSVYWTYGGTQAYFAMVWGGQRSDTPAVIFWADPVKAAGRPQYQALTEITKGVKVTLLPADNPL